MKHVALLSVSCLIGLAAFAVVPGCSDDETTTSTPTDTDAGGDGAVAIRDLGAPNIPCNDSADSLYGDPGPLPEGRGTIVKCHEDPNLSQDSLQTRLNELGYKGKALSSGARVMRVTFTTERGDTANSRAVSSALVYVPTNPRANDLPLVVVARGSRGQGPECAASKRKPGLGVNDDLDRIAYTVVGHGYAAIVPDLPGYANFGAVGNPPSAYNDARDVGKGTLDGSRALKQLYPKLADKTVIVGLSQGGHSALAALSLADSYGVQGTMAGVAVYAPLWMSQRTWGALLSPSIAQQLNATIHDSAAPSAITIWYHYTKAELLDGPGEGAKLFKESARAAVKQFVEEQCWADSYPQLEALGTYAYELFETPMLNVGAPAAGLGDCDSADTLCQKWIARYKADRPPLTGRAASTPILLLYGGKDTSVPANRFRCALDRLVEDGTKLSVCFDPEGGHGALIDLKGDYVADWIAGITLGAALPPACAQGAEAVTETCATPPPND
jgi:pimeloyl-ACP methyl ester carboxylesterase